MLLVVVVDAVAAETGVEVCSDVVMTVAEAADALVNCDPCSLVAPAVEGIPAAWTCVLNLPGTPAGHGGFAARIAGHTAHGVGQGAGADAEVGVASAHLEDRYRKEDWANRRIPAGLVVEVLVMNAAAGVVERDLRRDDECDLLEDAVTSVRRVAR
jgi:hypothetical protein